MKIIVEIVGWFLGIGLICIFGLMTIIQGPILLISPQIEIFKDDQLIYQGNKACVSVQSGGDTTTVEIGKGYMCVFPGQYIVGKNIEIRNK